MATANPAFDNIQTDTNRVRKVLLPSSSVGRSRTSTASQAEIARPTTVLKFASRSSSVLTTSWTVAASSVFSLEDFKVGSASALSDPLVPPVTIWKVERDQQQLREWERGREWNPTHMKRRVGYKTHRPVNESGQQSQSTSFILVHIERRGGMIGLPTFKTLVNEGAKAKPNQMV